MRRIFIALLLVATFFLSACESGFSPPDPIEDCESGSPPSVSSYIERHPTLGFGWHQDFLELYHDFLAYSLGDFEVVYEGAGFGSAGSWRVWTLQYTHHNGETSEFSFSNVDMAREVLGHADSVLRRELMEIEVVRRYFAEAELVDEINGSLSNDTSVFLYIQPAAHWFHSGPLGDMVSRPSEMQTMVMDYNALLNSRHGMRLATITYREAIDDWGLRVRIHATHRNIGTYEDALERFKAMTRELAEHLGQDYIEVTFRLHDPSLTGSRNFSRYFFSGITPPVLNSLDLEPFNLELNDLADIMRGGLVDAHEPLNYWDNYEAYANFIFEIMHNISFTGYYDRNTDTFEIMTIAQRHAILNADSE